MRRFCEEEEEVEAEERRVRYLHTAEKTGGVSVLRSMRKEACSVSRRKSEVCGVLTWGGRSTCDIPGKCWGGGEGRGLKCIPGKIRWGGYG